MATGVGTLFKTRLSSGGATLSGSTFKAYLYSTGYLDIGSTVRMDQDYFLNPTNSSQSLHAYYLSTVTAVTIGTRTMTEVDARNAVEIDSTDFAFSAVSSSAISSTAATGPGVAGGVAFVAELQAAASSGAVLACFYDFTTALTLNGGDVTVQFSTGGWLEFLASTSNATP